MNLSAQTREERYKNKTTRDEFLLRIKTTIRIRELRILYHYMPKYDIHNVWSF